MIKNFSYFTFLLLANFSIAQTVTQDEQQITENERIIIDNTQNKLLNEPLDQINHIAHLLDYLKILLSNQSKQFHNAPEFKAYLEKISAIVAQIKNNSFVAPDPELIVALNKINTALCLNLLKALQKNDLTPFSPEKDIKRSLEQDISIAEIQADLATNHRLIKQLENEIERFGLTASQKLVRRIEDLYNSSKFYIEQRELAKPIKYTALSLAGLTYLIYNLPSPAKPKVGEKTSLLKSAFIRLKKIIGANPIYNISESQIAQDLTLLEKMSKALNLNPKYSCSVLNYDNLGLLGHLEWHFSNLTNTELKPSVLLPGVASGYLSYEIIKEQRLLSYSMFLSDNPMIRMMAITNQLLYVTNEDPYKDFKQKVKKFFISKHQEIRGQSHKSLQQKPTNTFKDIIGLDYAKNEFEQVIDYIINPEKFERSKLVPNKGYLMVGAPRTGKSFIASAVCGEINERQKLLGKPNSTSFIHLTPDTINRYSFAEIMYYINNNAPCVVFIDEIDLLALNRGDGNKENRLLSEILTSMSGGNNLGINSESAHPKQVVFFAATNNPNSLDAALLQSGRFGKIISFDYPKLNERLEYMIKELEKRSINLNPDFVIEICQELEGSSFEDLNLIITTAIQKATSKYTSIDESHFRYAINHAIKGILPQVQTLSDDELATITTFQAGKALATKLLLPTLNISTVTTQPISRKIVTKEKKQTIIDPIIEQGGIFTYKNDQLLDLKNEAYLIKECQIALAGHVAQALILGNSCYNYRPQDQQEASKIARQIALKGESYDELTPDLKEKVVRDAYLIKANCQNQIEALLKENLKQLNLITDKLRKEKYLSEKEFNQLLN